MNARPQCWKQSSEDIGDNERLILRFSVLTAVLQKIRILEVLFVMVTKNFVHTGDFLSGR